LLCVVPARLDRRHARRMIKPVKISDSTEYQVARWFDLHEGGGRVMAPGTVSYWINAFTDTPQIGGAFDPGAVLPTHAMSEYVLYSGEGAEGAMPVAGRFGGNTIYWVPERSASLAHTVPPDALVRTPPVNGIDVMQLSQYVRALDDVTIPLANFRWTSRHSADIHATIQRGQLLSVQVTYHRGWHARVNGAPGNLFSDGLGLIAIAPNCDGQCNVQLAYDGGTEMLVARIVSWSALVACVLWAAIPLWKAQPKIP
jgi:hypothetical protein